MQERWIVKEAIEIETISNYKPETVLPEAQRSSDDGREPKTRGAVELDPTRNVAGSS